MKIAIQKTKTGFTNRWISYCQEKKYDFIIIDIYNNSFIESDLKIDIFLWHVSHENHKDNLIAYKSIFQADANNANFIASKVNSIIIELDNALNGKSINQQQFYQALNYNNKYLDNMIII